MSRRPLSSELRGRDVSRVRPAQHEIGRARHHPSARPNVGFRLGGRLDAWWGTPRSPTPSPAPPPPRGRGGIVVAGQRRPVLPARRTIAMVRLAVSAPDRPTAWRSARPARRRRCRHSCPGCTRGTLRSSRNCRCPGVWSISETSRTSGRPISSPGFRDNVRHRHLATQMQKVVDAKQLRASRAVAIASARTSRFAVDFLGALFTPHAQRGRSSTVVMPQVASCPVTDAPAATAFPVHLQGRGISCSSR